MRSNHTYTFTVYLIESCYHGDIKSVAFEADTPDGAFDWIEDNPIESGSYCKYQVTAERAAIYEQITISHSALKEDIVIIKEQSK